MSNSLSVVINYSTNDHDFLAPCIEECLKFSNDIVVSYTTHMYNGELENLSLVENAQMRYKNDPVKFHAYEYDHNITKRRGTRYWHNHARYTGWQKTKIKDWTLFLDVDEIPDGKRFDQWMKFKAVKRPYYTFEAYWYFREPIYQAKTTEQTTLLFDNEELTENIFYSEGERWGMMKRFNGGLQRVKGLDGEPMFHHYSWVRSEKQMLNKVNSWGHMNDRDWEALVKEEFTHDFNGTDFVHNYQYRVLEKPFKDV